jgi:hypothetical protein
VRTTLSLITLLLISVLALVAPTDCGCPLDQHHGQALHPVFAHVHPDEPDLSGSRDDLLQPLAQPEFRNSLDAGPAGQNVPVGQVMPALAVLLPATPWRSLSPVLLVTLPPGLSIAPPDPPPNLT